MPELHLCANCLEVGAGPYPVGPETGSQRDPTRAHLDLCGDCAAALTSGDLARFTDRYQSQRQVTRA